MSKIATTNEQEQIRQNTMKLRDLLNLSSNRGSTTNPSSPQRGKTLQTILQNNYLNQNVFTLTPRRYSKMAKESGARELSIKRFASKGEGKNAVKQTIAYLPLSLQRPWHQKIYIFGPLLPFLSLCSGAKICQSVEIFTR